jgi:hypothetical protein
MISIEGIPIVAARLAQAAQDAKEIRGHKEVAVGRSASRRLQQDHARALFRGHSRNPNPRVISKSVKGSTVRAGLINPV